ncbi:cytochrome P450 monooxygenase [Byssothecium circinans]|uniref:Cytochrome P450 monooxygenase n=1 Tax=Byssothecium circinans TaxID=147558 RepID=A0A6A5TBW9_9PLEO|nr:cytochrome P450 monooxygenase [Byssothecium circinans]
MFGLLLSVFAAAYLVWSLICLETNYRRAKSMGIPLIRLPIDPLNILFQVFESQVWGILDRLPVKAILPQWTTYARRGWFFEDKADTALRLGKIWGLVTPVGILVQLTDPEAIDDVLSRRMDFQRPTEPYTILEVFGPCISSADADNWARHRKVLAAPFNESIMSFVWSESLQQAQDLIACWTKDGIKSCSRDTRTLSLNVLAATGFKKSFKFRHWKRDEPQSTDADLSYRDALQIILDNALLLLILRPKFLSFRYLPKSWQRIGKAAAAFEGYMRQMMDEEMQSLNQGTKGSGSLMTSLVRAGDAYSKGSANDGNRIKGLSVDEIFGNIFVINFAGHDTTANTLAFGVLLLAAYPEVQNWIAEEVRRFCKEMEPKSWQYNDLFPKLVRCQAVMYEILRLYPPVLALQKGTRSSSQLIHASDRTITIPPNVQVFSCVPATHCHPDHYPDPLRFQPSRWVENQTGSLEETLVTPRKGAYLAWADGPQVCPGLKFSQVEFVAVLACLIQSCKIETIKLDGEGEQTMRDRVLKVLNDCDFQLLLRMKDAESIQLRYVKV